MNADAEKGLSAALLQSLRDGVITLDNHGRILSANRAWEAITGRSKEAIVGIEPPYPWWPTNDDGASERLFDEMLTKGESFESERTVVRPDGSVIIALGSGTPIIGASGVRTGWVVIYNDVTDRILHEQEVAIHASQLEKLNTELIARADQLESLNVELAAMSEFNASLIEHAPDASLVIDSHGRIVAANVQASVLLGYSRTDLTAMTVDQVVPAQVHLLHPELWKDYGANVTLRPTAAQLELTAMREDGSEIPVDILLRPFAIDGSNLVLTVARDITDRRSVDSARREADRANRAKSEFLSRMSHELRTPLGAVLGFIAIMSEEKADLAPRHRDMVKRMDRAGHHIMSLINDVLDISRIESGQLSLSIEPVEVAEAVERAAEIVDLLFVEQSLTFEVDIDPTWHVLGDRSRLQQVMVNLISNAAKYNRRLGRIRVDAVNEGDDLRISCSDTGVGIDPSRLEDLFVPFARLGAERSRVEGTGLGLALSKALVTQMGGRLELVESSTAGSTFAVWLPGIRAEHRVAAQSVIDANKFAKLQNTQASIVSIEDNEDNIVVLREMLRACEKIELQAATDGRSGIDLVRKILPDMVFIDLHLSDMDGRTVLVALRDDMRTRSIPVVVLTGDAMGSSRAELLSLGAQEYLTKPLSPSELARVVTNFV